jgi:hypothetical protein
MLNTLLHAYAEESTRAVDIQYISVHASTFSFSVFPEGILSTSGITGKSDLDIRTSSRNSSNAQLQRPHFCKTGFIKAQPA